MKTTAIAMVGVLLLAGGLAAQKTPSFSVRNDETFTGKITDSICGAGHHIDVVKSDRNCILTCVKFDGAQFVLYNSETKRIYMLDDQDVTVIGRYDKAAKEILVTTIRPKIIYAGL